MNRWMEIFNLVEFGSKIRNHIAHDHSGNQGTENI